MNINVQGLTLFNRIGASKSTLDRLDRQEKRDNKIAFIEKQKDNLKNIKSESIEDIQRKLAMLDDYNEQIAAAKAEYNHEQAFHVLDEAWEQGEKIAEAAEKAAPKTPEERREELIEEATGIEKNDGLLADMLDETMEELEDLAEASEELMEETVQDFETAENIEGAEILEPTEDLEGSEGNQLKSQDPSGMTEEEKEKLLTHYKRIDLKV